MFKVVNLIILGSFAAAYKSLCDLYNQVPLEEVIWVRIFLLSFFDPKFCSKGPIKSAFNVLIIKYISLRLYLVYLEDKITDSFVYHPDLSH